MRLISDTIKKIAYIYIIMCRTFSRTQRSMVEMTELTLLSPSNVNQCLPLICRILLTHTHIHTWSLIKRYHICIAEHFIEQLSNNPKLLFIQAYNFSCYFTNLALCTQRSIITCIIGSPSLFSENHHTK